MLVATPETEVNEAVLIRLYEEILTITTNSYIINQISKDTDYIALAHIYEVHVDLLPSFLNIPLIFLTAFIIGEGIFSISPLC